VIVAPSRRLTNVLLVYTDQQFRAEMARQRALLKQAQANAKSAAAALEREHPAIPVFDPRFG